MTVLVIGATGNVGAAVVRELAARGERPRAFVRSPQKAAALFGDDADVLRGDLADADSLRRALDGVDRLFLACANVPGQVEYECAAIDAAGAAGVGRIVKLSALSAAVDAPLLFPRWQGEIERHLQRSGVPNVVLRPGSYMTNLLANADAIRQTGKLFAPAGEARIAMVDPRDIAAVAAVALVEDGHEGNAYAPTGPAAITYDDVAHELSSATGNAITYVNVSGAAARQAMLEQGVPVQVADFVVAMFAALRGGFAGQTTDDVHRVTGRSPRDFAAFARDHAAAFGAGARMGTVPFHAAQGAR